MTTTQIHGLPTPPLGYRLANIGDTRCEGAKFWNPDRAQRLIAAGGITGPLVPYYIYAVPLNDGYEYHEAGTTVIQAGDEALVRPGDWYEMSEALVGQSNRHCLRRPKAKPSPFAKGWNPLKLTDHQVGEGYRLLELGESREGSEYRLEIGDGEWHPANPGGIVTNPTLHHSHACHRVRISPLAPGRNINGLTEDQVGVADGWRLITLEDKRIPLDLQMWSKDQRWVPSAHAGEDYDMPSNGNDYRTKAPLPGEKAKTEMCQFIRPGGYVTTVELTPRAADIILPLLMELANGGHVSSVLPGKEAH